MKRFLSIILAVSMILTSGITAFAVESEPAGEYNSLKLPVVNEIRDNNDEVKTEVTMKSFASAPMLMSLGDEPRPSQGRPSSGGGSSGRPSSGGGSSAINKDKIPFVDNYDRFNDKITTVEITNDQTCEQGKQLKIENVMSYISDDDDKENFRGFFDEFNVWYYQDTNVIVYEKDGKETIDFCSRETGSYECGILNSDGGQLPGSEGSGTNFEQVEDSAYTLFVNIPKELESGTYNVSFYQNAYSKADYAYAKFDFKLNVTNGSGDYSICKHENLLNSSITSLEGDWDTDGYFYAEEDGRFRDYWPEGFAISKEGYLYPLGADVALCVDEDGDEVVRFRLYDYIACFPASEYKCYFYNNLEYEENEYNVLYGPGTLNIQSVAFADKYYTASNDVWTEIRFGNSSAEELPEGIENEECTLSVEFKDKEGKSIHSMDEIAIDNLYIYRDSYSGNIYNACLYTYFNFIGFEPGTYYADITLNDSEGEAYELGSAILQITDKTIIDYISILNYGNTLSTSTENFYVELDVNNMFLDYDKINIKLVDKYTGAVVAETVSKSIEDIYSNSTTLLYKLSVTGTLEEDGNYVLDIQSDKDLELISEVDNVYINVYNNPNVVRAELVNSNTVKIFTENVEPGEYKVKESGSDVYYDILIDEQGIGTFTWEGNHTSSSTYFYLYSISENYIDSFYVRIPTESYRFDCEPKFLSAKTTTINDFYARPKSDSDRPTIDDIDYARITQDGEVIATISNMKIDGWSYYNREAGTRPELYGTLTVVSGKAFKAGEATYEIKYKSGFVYKSTIPVASEADEIYGSLNLDNSCYFSKHLPNGYINEVTSNQKASFTILNTNVVDGEVALWDNGTQQFIETLNLSEMTKDTKYGYCYTYKGAFKTVLSSDKSYSIYFKANNYEISTSSFTYLPNKIADADMESFVAANGEGEIYLYNWLNISDITKLKFKAVVKGTTYDVPVKEDYKGDNYINFTADYSKVPAGYYKLKIYDGSDEVLLATNNGNIGYNYGSVAAKPFVTGSGWTWIKNGQNQVREFRIYGTNLDKAKTAVVKLYKLVDFKESNNYEQTKLQYVKDIELSKPYQKTYIALSNDLLEDVETGAYTLVYMVDGKPERTQDVYIRGNEHKAEITLNDGIAYTNKPSVNMDISYNGYTKMKYAFSEADLAGVAYEDIATSKTISLTGDGAKTIYVQFANDDESKTDIKSASITVDTTAPEVSDVVFTSPIALWNSEEITFTSNELLRNGFVIITGADDAKRTYVAALESSEGGVYKYKCNLYADSWYDDKASLNLQISAIDKAGNKTDGELKQFEVLQPRNISGTVTYLGSPVSDCIVYLRARTATGEYTYTYTYTNQDGGYTFYNIPAGDYYVYISRYGYEESSFDIIESEFTSGDITGKDLALESIYKNNSTINVTVVDSIGNAVKDAYVSAYSYDANININAVTDEAGKATLNVPYSDRGTDFRIYVTSNDYSKSQYVTVNESSKEITVTLPKKAEINGIVKNGEDVVKYTEVVIEGNGYTSYAITDEEGKFTATVYLSGDKTFAVRVNGTSLSGMETVTFGDEETSKEITLNVSQNIRVKGTLKDNMGKPVSDFRSIYFSGNGVYQTVTLDDEGNFETLDSFGPGKYTVSAYPQWNYNGNKYEDIYETFEISEDDMQSPAFELNLEAKPIKDALFTTGVNGISATADIIAKGDKVTVSVKFQNDGTKLLSDVTAYAEIPDGLDVKKTNGTKSEDGKKVSKSVETLKPDEAGTLTFTLGTDNFDDTAIVIPAYVKVGNKTYNLGIVTIGIVSITLDAPEVVKKDTVFKVSGESISGSTVEISNYDTKEILATTDLVSKWYAAEISGLSADTKLIAKVTTKDGKVAYSEPVTVKVEEAPVEFVDAKLSWILSDYGVNASYGYPTGTVWDGYEFSIKAKFSNISPDATVKYSFNGKNNISSTKIDDYFSATIKNWSGYGTKKIYATVTDGDKEYIFVVAEILVLVDPSGIITDAETGKPIVGANVLLEEKKPDGSWATWDATPHLQVNPMITDEVGHYGWMVPEGEYRIIVTADGYDTKIVEEYNSRDYGDNSKITVLPVRTDVDIQLVNSHAIEVKDELSVAGKIKIVFSRPVDVSQLSANSISVSKDDGTSVAGTIIWAENNTVALFKPEETMSNGNYKLAVSGIKDMNGNAMATEEIPFEKQTDITAMPEPTVSYDSANGIVVITFAEGTEPVNTEEITVKNSTADVPGTIRKAGNVLTFIPDNALTSATTYNVVVSEALRTESNNYLQNKYESSFTTPGGSHSGNGGGGGGGAATATYTITVTQAQNGKISPDTVKVEKGKNQTFTITPNDGYTIKDVIVNGESVGAVSSYTFEKVDKAQTITAEFEKKEAVKWGSFTDVKETDWFYDAVKFAFENGITSGVSETEFAPQGIVTRGQFITMLCRAYKVPEMTGDNFSDCGNTWYTGYLAAAKQLGISNGVGDNMFAPEKEITREEMVTLIYNYLKSIGETEGEFGDTQFADDYLISDWAKAGVAFASEKGYVNGKGNNTFDPNGKATRAELAQIFFNIFK